MKYLPILLILVGCELPEIDIDYPEFHCYKGYQYDLHWQPMINPDNGAAYVCSGETNE